MKRIILLVLPVFLLALAGCGSMVTLEKAKAVSMTPEVRMNIGLDDVQYLGETSISVSSHTYCGIFHQIDKVNGFEFNRRNNTVVSMCGNLNLDLKGDLKLAGHKVIREFPNADYYVPAFYKEDVVNMFLGKKTTQTMVIKAYKYKTK